MIIDFHTHLWPKEDTTVSLVEYFKSRKIWDESLSAVTSETLIRIMDENSIKKSVVLSVALRSGMRSDEIDKINTYVSEEVSRSDGRLVGFCTVNPFSGKSSIKTVEKAVEYLGLRGLKLHPSFQVFYPNDHKLYPLYDKMKSYKLPVLFHTGSIGILPFRDLYSNPIYIDDVACDFPDLIIILGHAGKIWYDEAVMLMRKHKNIYVDISTNIGRSESFAALPLSWFLYKVKVWAGNLDRVLFGSDYPFYFQNETLNYLYEARNYLNKDNKNFMSEGDLKNIIYLNAERLINSLNI